MFCEKCGAEVTGNTKFCTKCGNKIGGGNTIDPATFNGGASNVNIQMEPPKVKGNGGKKLGLIISLVTVAVALVGLIVFLFTSTGMVDRIEEVFNGSAHVSDDDSELLEKDDEEEDEDDEDDGEETDEEEVVNKEFTGKRVPVDINVRQVDNSNFPNVTLYANVVDDSGNNVENLKSSDLVVKEIAGDGSVIDASIEDVYRLMNEDKININLVLDQSGSMSGSKMTQAKNAANSFIDSMTLDKGDKVEIISFDDYVYLKQEFTSQSSLLHAAIDGITPDSSTALLDAIYAGVYQTYPETGAKCVIAFTDGAENASSYSYDDVVEISRNTGIPVYIIGIGDGYDSSMLQNLAAECSGRYYSADTDDLQSILEDIYISIYREQQDYYVIKYTSSDTTNTTEFRDIVLETSPSSEFTGTYTKSYVPQADITGAFASDYADKDFMIDDSDTRSLTESDLKGMSLAQLRIARNEIFARHGRQFKDPMLNQWFYSKQWYLNINDKYSPSQFESLRPSPLSKTEIANCDFIKKYEDDKMRSEEIYPDAATSELSEYDLALTDDVLEKALKQLNSYPSTATLEENKKRIQEAIDKDDIKY